MVGTLLLWRNWLSTQVLITIVTIPFGIHYFLDDDLWKLLLITNTESLVGHFVCKRILVIYDRIILGFCCWLKM